MEYRRGKLTGLGTTGSNESEYVAINNKGDVTGLQATNGDDILLLPRGKQIDIGSLNGLGSVGLGLNNAGEVVGYSVISGRGNDQRGLSRLRF